MPHPDPLEKLYLRSEELVNDIISLQKAIIEDEGVAAFDTRLGKVEATLDCVCYAYHGLLDARNDVVRRFKETVNAAP